MKAAPLILIGVGLSLGFRANVWNIGAEGQYTLGAIFAAGLALAYPDAPADRPAAGDDAARHPGRHGYGLPMPAYLRTRWNANEILTSLMLTYVAQLLLIYLVTGPWRDPEGYGFPQTALVLRQRDAADPGRGHARASRRRWSRSWWRSSAGSC